MFRKLVSNLSFSPALITQVGFYAHRLRQEEITRRMTVFFVVLALIVQSLAVFTPPESANASSEQDLIRGGVQSLDDFLVRYDKNTDDIKDIYTTLGVQRDEIAAAKPGTFNSKESIYSLSRYGQYSPESGETSFSYKRSSGGNGLRYISPLALSDTSDAKKRTGTTYDAWIGQSSKLGWFAIVKASASLATKGFPSTITPDSSSTVSKTSKTIVTQNMTQGVNAEARLAKPYDKISYTVTIKNEGGKTVQSPLSVSLADTLEYSSLVDDGGGKLDPATKSLSWGVVAIPPGASQERMFAVQILSSIPAMPTGKSNANSYDCMMATNFGASSRIGVDCPAIKGAESIVGDFPRVGAWANGIFALTVLLVVIYFYLRTKQLKKEIRLIRHNMNTGTI